MFVSVQYRTLTSNWWNKAEHANTKPIILLLIVYLSSGFGVCRRPAVMWDDCGSHQQMCPCPLPHRLPGDVRRQAWLIRAHQQRLQAALPAKIPCSLLLADGHRHPAQTEMGEIQLETHLNKTHLRCRVRVSAKRVNVQFSVVWFYPSATVV